MTIVGMKEPVRSFYLETYDKVKGNQSNIIDRNFFAEFMMNKVLTKELFPIKNWSCSPILKKLTLLQHFKYKKIYDLFVKIYILKNAESSQGLTGLISSFCSLFNKGMRIAGIHEYVGFNQALYISFEELIGRVHENPELGENEENFIFLYDFLSCVNLQAFYSSSDFTDFVGRKFTGVYLESIMVEIKSVSNVFDKPEKLFQNLCMTGLPKDIIYEIFNKYFKLFVL